MLKLSFKTNDDKLNHLLTEIEDAVSTREETKQKQDRITAILKTEPTVRSMANGDRKIYHDGSNYWEYIKSGGKVFKHQLTML